MEQIVRARRIAIAVCLLAAFSRCPAQIAGEPAMEYQVRAAFLLNFTKFIEWPHVESAGAESQARICIMGDDPFGALLDQMADGEVLQERKLVVQRLHQETPKACDVIYFSKGEQQDIGSVLSDIGPGVLTVGEGDAFLREGGVIAFVVENRRVRFDINQKAAVKAGLKISSKLMSVARFVAK
jgi:hypothetical protein